MLRRKTGHRQRSKTILLPPIQFLDTGNLMLLEPSLQPQRHKKKRIMRGCKMLDGFQVKMVVMIMRDDDQVYGRKVFETNSRRRYARGSCKRDGAGPMGPLG